MDLTSNLKPGGDESAREIASLKMRLQEAEDVLHAIQTGEVDALIVQTAEGERVFTLSGADQVYRIFINSMEQGAVVLGPGDVITYCNVSFANLVALPLHLIIGKYVQSFMMDADRETYSGLVKKAATMPCSAEINFRTPAGDAIETMVSLNAIPSGPAAVTCMIVTDLRPHRKNLEALRESKEWFQVLADSMPHIVWTADTSGQATYFNRRWFEFNSPADSTGPANNKTLTAIIHPQDLPLYQDTWARLVKDPQPFDVECRLRGAATREYRWHLIRGLPVMNKGGFTLQWICTCTDIHDQKCTEQELARSNDELARFAYVASHDLQEPLRKVLNYAGLFAARYHDQMDENGRRYLNQILEGSRRMRDLIEGLLRFSRVGNEQVECQVLSMSKAMNVVLSDLSTLIHQAGASIEVKPLPCLKFPRSELYQILSNLISNAIKFKREGTIPHVLVEAIRQPNDDLMLKVEDNGIGIENEYLNQIFIPFKRLNTQNKYPGAGLGLSICKKIIERHGGKIWVESQFGIGTCVYVVLPAPLLAWNQDDEQEVS